MARRIPLLTGIALVTGSLLLAPGNMAPARAQAPVAIDKNLEIPLSNGSFVRGDLYRPIVDGKPGERLPTIITYFPYNKDDTSRFEITGMHLFAEHGYAALLVDAPGTGASPGEFGFISTAEVQAGRDVVDWAAAQAFSNGRTGMWGYSFPGILAAHVAATQPPSMRAVVPASIFHDPYRDVVFPGGILTTQDGVGLLPVMVVMGTLRLRQQTEPQIALEQLAEVVTEPGDLLTLAEAATHTTYDAYWQERALENKVANITAPTLLWSGWGDIYQRATPLLYEDVGAEHVGMVMGPWGHLAGASGDLLDFHLAETLRWFDTFLRRDATALEAAEVSTVRVFDVDWRADLAWDVWPGQLVELPSWPPPARTMTLELCTVPTSTPDPGAPWPNQGRLGETCDLAGSLPVPNVPADATGGGSIGHDAFANQYGSELWDDKDQRLSLQSTAWIAEPFDEDVVLTGSMTASLVASTVGTDADWVVRVVDIGPDRVRAIAPGWLRASHRAEATDRPYLWHTHDDPQAVTPGEPYDMNIEVWPNSYVLPAGHRLGLLVRTGDSLKVSGGTTSAVSSILTGPDGPSTLTFDVRAAGAATPVPQPDGTVPPSSDADPGPTPTTGGGTAMLALLLGLLAVGVRRR